MVRVEEYPEFDLAESGGSTARLVIRDPETGRPQYHMVHASDHPAAFGLMRWAEVQASGSSYVNLALPGLGGR